MWGYHLSLDCRSCNDNVKFPNEHKIAEFAIQLVKDIDMIAYGSPQVVHFGKDDKTGYTLVQLIETSNICGHFCDDSGDAYIDVFSCKPFDVSAVISLVKTIFDPVSIRQTFLTRQA